MLSTSTLLTFSRVSKTLRKCTRKIERAARDEILLCGGSLSHHHGVGNLRKEFLPRIMSAEALEWDRNIKNAVDPNHVFGCGHVVEQR